MDIHRCRFVPYPLSAINALAFSHRSSPLGGRPTPSTLRLAIGRANGSIEIWNPIGGRWTQETVIHGGKDRSIEGLVWTQDSGEEDAGENGHLKRGEGRLRLFSIGYSNALVEWDLEKGLVKRIERGGSGDAWCVAVQPRAEIGTERVGGGVGGEGGAQHIVMGCADGNLAVFDTADGDLSFKRLVVHPSGKRKSRVLSLAFQGSGRVVAGYSDGAIRVYAPFGARGSEAVRTMTLGGTARRRAGEGRGPSEILVWSVETLANGTIVSGDSTGEVKIWDGKNYTLVQRLHSHRADVLNLAVSADGSTIFSGGMDRRTVVYQRITDPKAGAWGRWAEVAHRKIHQYDVKSMTSFESQDLSIVVSGGVDAVPRVTPLRQFGREHPLALPEFPQSQPPLRSAPEARLLCSWWQREIWVWRITDPGEDALAEEDDEPARPKKLVARINIDGDRNITSVDISRDGSILAVSTVAGVKTFRLRERVDPSKPGLKVRKLEIPPSISGQGGRLISLSPDCKWLLLVTLDNSVVLHRITETEDPKGDPAILPQPVELRPRRVDRKSARKMADVLGTYLQTIAKVAWSSDSRILAVADLYGNLDAFVLEGNEDKSLGVASEAHRKDGEASDSESDDEKHPTLIYGQHWIHAPGKRFPRIPGQPLVLSFRPSHANPTTNGIHTTTPTLHSTRHTPHPHSHDLPQGEDRLLVVTAKHEIYEYNALSSQLSGWSRRNPPSNLPQDFKILTNKAMGAIWDTSLSCERVWLYGSTWLWMIDLDRDIPLPEADAASEGENYADGQSKALIAGRKRKREFDRGTSGAGGHVRSNELANGIGKGMVKSRIDPERGQPEQKWVPFDRHSKRRSRTDQSASDGEGVDESDEDSTDDQHRSSNTLVRLRRRGSGGGGGDQPAASSSKVNGLHAAIDTPATDDGAAGDRGELAVYDEQDEAGQVEDQRPQFWKTLKYRPILGIVPLSRSPGTGTAGGAEVVLVERPPWDCDLPGKVEDR